MTHRIVVAVCLMGDFAAFGKPELDVDSHA
jgi:hypothetical protein